VFYCLDAPARRTPRSQHSVLEIAAGFGSHTVLSKITIPLVILPVIALRSCLRSGDHAADKQRKPAGARSESGDDVCPLPGVSELAGNALRSDRDRALACTDLRLAIAGLRLARRATFLWAVLPLIVIQIFEKITFNTSYFGKMLQHRLMGFAPHAFGFHGEGNPTIDSLVQLTPGRYLGSAGLWLGY